MKELITLWGCLGKRARLRFIGVALLTTICGLAETLSVGLLIPFVASASNATPFSASGRITEWLKSAVSACGVPPGNLTMTLGILVVLGLCSTNFTTFIFQWLSFKAIFEEKNEIATRLLQDYTYQPVDFFDHGNTSELLNSLWTDVDALVSSLASVVQLVAIVVRCVLLYSFLLYIQTRLALLVLIAFVCGYAIVYGCVHRPLMKAANQGATATSTMYQISVEILTGNRDIRVSNSQQQFLLKFGEASRRSIYPQVIRALPAYATKAGFEVAAVAIIVGILIYFNAKDGNLSNGLPLLSAYSLAGLRLMPALQQALSFLMQIQYNQPFVTRIQGFLRSPSVIQESESPISIDFEQSIEFRRVDFSYRESDILLKKISFTVPKLARIALVGSTGAGKSTIVDLLLGLRWPSGGAILIDGTPLDAKNLRCWRSKVGVVPQRIFLLDASVAENVAMGIPEDQIDQERLVTACETANIHEFITTQLPGSYSTRIGERGVRLSGGQCQRLAIARALYRDPEVVIFDEATSSLDNATEQSVMEALHNLSGKKTLIVVAHRLSTVWDFDQLVVVENGRVVAVGSAEELLETSQEFRQIAMRKSTTLDCTMETPR